jgi:hypothetical protein
VFRVLAYVFWHAPRSIDGIAAYEAALAGFHRSLDPAGIGGFGGSQAFLVQGAVWVSSPVVYEDWYLVDDFTALGELNVAAVSAHRQRPHDDVARIAAKGTAGVYALRQGPHGCRTRHAPRGSTRPSECPMRSSSVDLASADLCGSGRWCSDRHQSSAPLMTTNRLAAQ